VPGGEEFVLLLPNTDAKGCALIGETVRSDLREISMLHALNPPSKQVTVSLGAATTCTTAEPADSASLLMAADRALYQAKEDGRDRLVASDAVACGPSAQHSLPRSDIGS
jgi:diguanylate cyclase (GGDEF)-like protein